MFKLKKEVSPKTKHPLSRFGFPPTAEMINSCFQETVKQCQVYTVTAKQIQTTFCCAVLSPPAPPCLRPMLLCMEQPGAWKHSATALWIQISISTTVY